MWPSLSSGHTMITSSGSPNAAGSRRYMSSISEYIVKWKIGVRPGGSALRTMVVCRPITSRNTLALPESVVPSGQV